MKHLLLIDRDDPRRQTRVLLLEGEGHKVTTLNRFEEMDGFKEIDFDLVIIAIQQESGTSSLDYAEHLKEKHPVLPVLLLAESGVFLSTSLLPEKARSEFPAEVLAQIARMLLHSSHVSLKRSHIA